MTRTFSTFVWHLCASAIWRWTWLQPLAFRYLCPYPVSERHRWARRCCGLGDCACDNALRYPSAEIERLREALEHLPEKEKEDVR